MTTITKRVPVEQIPKPWLEGIEDLKGVPVVQVTLEVSSTEDSPKIPPERFNELLRQMSKVGKELPHVDLADTVRSLRDEREKELLSRISS